MADAEEGGWIRAFSRVVCLDVNSGVRGLIGSGFSIAPFYGFSPILKSLRVGPTATLLLEIFGLIHSLPLLEDLSLVICGNDLSIHGLPAVIPSPTSPPFTGSLELALLKGAEPATRQLLDLPNGLHFRHLTFKSFQEDGVRWINALIDECSDTLESLDVKRRLVGAVVWLLCRNEHLTSVCRRFDAVFN